MKNFISPTLKDILSACLEAKALDPAIYISDKRSDTLSEDTRYNLIVSGRSDRHVLGITNRIKEDLRTGSNLKPLISEGLPRAHWVLLEYDDVIVHIFHTPIRDQYNLEALWKDLTPVDLNLVVPDAAEMLAVA